MSMIDFVTDATTEYIERMPKAQRKKYGQFFTSKETATFMASLFITTTSDKGKHITVAISNASNFFIVKSPFTSYIWQALFSVLRQ